MIKMGNKTIILDRHKSAHVIMFGIVIVTGTWTF
jgi:hypothetical protein